MVNDDEIPPLEVPIKLSITADVHQERQNHLESYRSLTLGYMADAFGITEEFMDQVIIKKMFHFHAKNLYFQRRKRKCLFCLHENNLIFWKTFSV